jgi:hypothetical protein
MIKQWFKTKTGSAILVAASLVLAGTIASVSAAPATGNVLGDTNGYSKDQCKNGGWRDFKNEDGSQKFRNQGQCIKYFVTGEEPGTSPVGHGQNFIHGFFSAILSFLSSFFGNLFGGLFSLRL